MKFKTGIVLSTLLIVSQPIFASDCVSDIAAIDSQLTTTDNGLSNVQMDQVMSLRDKAKAYCNLSDGDNAAAAITEIKSLLGNN